MTPLRRDFGPDRHPGRPRILLVGLAESTHTHAWVDLLAGARLNVRLFALPTFAAPDVLTIPTYVSAALEFMTEREDRAWLPVPPARLGALYNA